MTANVSDLTRVSGTITCSGSVAANTIDSAALRTALGFTTQNRRCDIGSVNGFYNQFAFSVTLGTATSWSFAVDYFGAGAYTTIATGQTTGSVTIGTLPGAVSASGAAVGACRPFAFKITLNAADATSTINFAAWKVDARIDLSTGSVASLSTSVAAIDTAIGETTDDIAATTIHGRLNLIRDDLVGIGGVDVSADVTTIKNAVGTTGTGGRTVAQCVEPHVLAYGLVTTAGGTGTVTVADFIGRFLINELLIIEDVSSSLTPKLRQSRSIASFNNATGACTVAALDFSPAVGDIVWVVPRAQTAP